MSDDMTSVSMYISNGGVNPNAKKLDTCTGPQMK